MIFFKKNIPYTDKNKRIRLVFTGCQHYGSKQFLRKDFKNFLAEYLDEEQSYLFILGDLFDAIISSDIKRYNPYEVENIFLDQVIEEVIKDLIPYKDKIIGICTGNHEYQYLKRYNLSLAKLVCNKLGVKHLGISFLVKLFIKRNGKDRVRNVTVYGHHGFGGGKISSSINKYLKKIEQFEADIYAFAHDHLPWHIRIPRIGINSRGKKFYKEIHLISVGSFKENLSSDTITWEEVRGYGPYIKGGKVIDIIPNKSSGVEIKLVF